MAHQWNAAKFVVKYTRVLGITKMIEWWSLQRKGIENIVDSLLYVWTVAHAAYNWYRLQRWFYRLASLFGVLLFRFLHIARWSCFIHDDWDFVKCFLDPSRTNTAAHNYSSDSGFAYVCCQPVCRKEAWGTCMYLQQKAITLLGLSSQPIQMRQKHELAQSFSQNVTFFRPC